MVVRPPQYLVPPNSLKSAAAKVLPHRMREVVLELRAPASREQWGSKVGPGQSQFKIERPMMFTFSVEDDLRFCSVKRFQAL